MQSNFHKPHVKFRSNSRWAYLIQSQHHKTGKSLQLTTTWSKGAHGWQRSENTKIKKPIAVCKDEILRSIVKKQHAIQNRHTDINNQTWSLQLTTDATRVWTIILSNTLLILQTQMATSLPTSQRKWSMLYTDEQGINFANWTYQKNCHIRHQLTCLTSNNADAEGTGLETSLTLSRWAQHVLEHVILQTCSRTRNVVRQMCEFER